jgi:hypothetical protein
VRDVILKAGLVWRILEGWAAADVVAHRLGVAIPVVVEARAWLEEHGYLERAASEVSWLYRWNPEREFEHLWDELVPDRPCALSFCGKAKPRGKARPHLSTT